MKEEKKKEEVKKEEKVEIKAEEKIEIKEEEKKSSEWSLVPEDSDDNKPISPEK